MKRKTWNTYLKILASNWKYRLLTYILLGLCFTLCFSHASVFAQENIENGNIPDISNEALAKAIDNLWVLIAGILVLFMQLGFSMLEAGFNAHKNVVNVLFKNIMDACLGILIFYMFGYVLMYHPDKLEGSFFLTELSLRTGASHLSVHIDLFFQAAFAATAATICSGAVAGRIKPGIYLVLAILITGFIYPIAGFQAWGNGWLSQIGFHDFAGSLVVHTVGGAAALAVVKILGPRKGKFSNWEEAEENDLLPHRLPLAAIGTFILWIGW